MFNLCILICIHFETVVCLYGMFHIVYGIKKTFDKIKFSEYKIQCST